ncbi:MAG: rhodanese-like domain-containing protein [Actinobacteria bacterium]|nr:rhodanese-like domain-containing protein [Actinomycetota bacterium]
MPPTLHVWQGEPPGPRTVIRRTHEERPHVDPVTAHEERDDVQFLDVREPYEWDAGHIEGAVHIPMGELNARRDEIAEDRTVVAVCRSGARSSQVAQALVRAGYPAENLDGGMQAWERAGLPFVATDGSDGEVA